jgi:amino-acid N-acetyltransferase
MGASMIAPSFKPDSLTYALGRPAELAAVAHLLAVNELPAEDIEPHIEDFVLARHDGNVIATAGFERCGSDGLLRSVCVDHRFRNHGIATELCNQIEAYAMNSAVDRFYLLTTTAQPFFESRGFSICERASVPQKIAATQEFRSLCPSTAICMNRRLCNGARYLPRHLLPLRQDVSGAKLWAVSLAKTMLTYFEVEPDTRFETHTHEAEQITTVIDGELFFEIEDKVIRVGPGEVIAIPSLIPHAVFTANTKAIAFDAWSPPPARYQ